MCNFLQLLFCDVFYASEDFWDLVALDPRTTVTNSIYFSWRQRGNSWFACDVIAAMLVYNNNRVVITFFCCVHQHGRHTLCHSNPWRLSANQEYSKFITLEFNQFLLCLVGSFFVSTLVTFMFICLRCRCSG